MSQETLAAQQWLNSTYGGHPSWVPVAETGLPGTATSFALIQALQIELGLYVDGDFGSVTMAACDANPLQYGSQGNRVKILQHGLWCKGYDPGLVDGDFGVLTENKVREIQTDAGLVGPQVSNTVYGMQMKAVIGYDEYKLVYRGDPRIRDIQQTLNRDYLTFTGLRPADGIYSRGTVTAMIMAIQVEQNTPSYDVDGYFGPLTQARIPDIPYSGAQLDANGVAYSSASIERFTLIAQWALYCIGRDGFGTGSLFDSGAFDGIYGVMTGLAMAAFRLSVMLPSRGYIGLDEWMALFLSTGNPNRAATAIDCATRLTDTTSQELYDAGYRIVGRYLTGDIVVGGQRVAKNLLRPEMKRIFEHGLSLFLIYQELRNFYNVEGGTDIRDYYTYQRGWDDATTAFPVCRSLGVPHGEYVYFTVGFDAIISDLAYGVIPYFQGVTEYAYSQGNPYAIGIYASREVCSIVSGEGYTTSSFVAGMSVGWSGNMGFRLPDDWAFDQIQNRPPGGGISIEVDRNVVSGRYTGFSGFIESQYDDEWDAISTNGEVSVSFESTALQVYWAKVQNQDGSFSAFHPIQDDTVPSNAFFSYRYQVSGGDPVDRIRYVYYRDSGGNLNAGYVDMTGVINIFPFA